MNIDEAFRSFEKPSTASWDDIQAAHRMLTKVWHPDRFASGSDLQSVAEAKQRQLNEALETLRQHFGGDSQSSKSASESSDEYPTQDMKSFAAQYVGGDPRLLFDNESCAVVLTQEVMAIVFDNGQFLTVPAKEIFGFSQGGGPIYERKQKRAKSNPKEKEENVSIWVADPEKVVDSFEIQLKFPNDYHAKVFKKHLMEIYGFERSLPTKANYESDFDGYGCPTVIVVIMLTIVLMGIMINGL